MSRALRILEMLTKAAVTVPLLTLLVRFAANALGSELPGFLREHASSDLARWIGGTLGGLGIAALWLSIWARPWLERFRREIVRGLWSYTMSTTLVLALLLYLRFTDGDVDPMGILIVTIWMCVGIRELVRWRPAKEPNQAPEPTPLLVTDRADARSAPSKGVAHL